MLTASAFVSLLLAATTTPPPLRVEITSPKTRVSIFEPVKLTVRATVVQPTVLPGMSGTSGFPVVETWIDHGNGFVQYVDEDGGPGHGVGG